MKANELMIGDWVINPIHKDKSKIEGIYFDKELNCLVATDGRFPQQWFEPIPLTAEILEKNGFSKRIIFDDMGNVVDDEDLMVYEFYEYDKKGNKCTGISISFIYHKIIDSAKVRHLCSFVQSSKINSVHKLQQALRLCGLNELSDNFKV